MSAAHDCYDQVLAMGHTPDTDTDTSAGMGVWMTVLGGVLGVVAGVLAFLDQK